MYPNLYYALRELFGIRVPVFKVINSFGFFVAIAFLAAAWALMKELQRKQAQGLLGYTEKKLVVGKPADSSELAFNFILGFVFGYKLLGLFLLKGALDDPQAYIFSTAGSLPGGVLTGALLAWLRWREKDKLKTSHPEERTIRIWPSDRVGDLTIIAAVAGFAGAKLFDNFENWDRFIRDPIGNLLSPSGLTFYGGLIIATLAIIYYLHRHRISIIHSADAIAPSLMLAYGLGRIGCQVAGDGDWGIVNLSPKPAAWIPSWAWSYTYPHNVNQQGVPIPGCDWGSYCSVLPQPVYPTPLYEIVICLVFFGILWYLRKRIVVAGRLAAVYLMLNGIERFFIEKIRVNTPQNFFGFHPTQAEIISTMLFVAGVVLYLVAPKLKPRVPAPSATTKTF